jgi:hypothetical protein
MIWFRMWRLRRRLRLLERAERQSRPSVRITATGSNVIAANVIHGDVTITHNRMEASESGHHVDIRINGSESGLMCDRFARW